MKRLFRALIFCFMISSLPFAYLFFITEPYIVPPKELPPTVRTDMQSISLPAANSSFRENGRVTTTITGAETIVPYDSVGINLQILIPSDLLTEWTLEGGGIEYIADNSRIPMPVYHINGQFWQTVYTIPGYILTTENNSSFSRPFAGEWDGGIFMQFTSEGPIGGWLEIVWLPKPAYFQNGNFNDTDLKFHIVTNVMVEPTSVGQLEAQQRFDAAQTLALGYLGLFFAPTAIWVGILVAVQNQKKRTSKKQSS